MGTGFLIVIYDPRTSGLLQHAQLIYSLVFRLLVADILLDLLFVFADGGYKVSSRPELLAGKVPFLTGVGPCYVNRTLAFDITYHLGNTMHVVRMQTADFNAQPLVSCQFC